MEERKMSERDMVIEKLRSICKEYSDILGVVILFGSYSRNEATELSDIDLYIEPKLQNMTTSVFGANRRYKEFKYALYDNFPNQFDLLAYGGKKDVSAMKRSPLWKQIEKDGVLLYDQRAEVV
jgi:predicted nucleotidyltransferase